MSVLSGDYIGFTYNGIHSSELGLIRVSDGSRYNEILLPSIQDKTVQVPGGDGTYFFGSYYTAKPFAISVAFDSLTELQLRRLKKIFGDKQVHSLIFDEAPFKQYFVKVTGTSSIKYLVFKEGTTGRVYKGEGEIQFTAYNPYAKSVHKYLEDYQTQKDSPNISSNFDEWKEASGMLENQGIYDIFQNNRIKLYNPGDIESDWKLKINFINGVIPKTNITILDKTISLSEIQAKGLDNFIEIDSSKNLIQGYQTIDGTTFKTGNLYNDSVIAGDFFKIPIIEKDTTKEVEMILDGDNIATNLEADSLQYDYYYY